MFAFYFLKLVQEHARKNGFGIRMKVEKYVDIWNPRNPGQWGITPKKNMLVIFPAWAPHKVEINKENFNRISISFNTQCKDHNK